MREYFYLNNAENYFRNALGGKVLMKLSDDDISALIDNEYYLIPDGGGHGNVLKGKEWKVFHQTLRATGVYGVPRDVLTLDLIKVKKLKDPKGSIHYMRGHRWLEKD